MTARVVLITGASSGIGYACALAFAARGWQVAALARRVDRLEQLNAAVAALTPPHGDLLALEADVRDAVSLDAAVAAALARFGRLDALIANAGLGQRGAVADSAWDDLEVVMRTNMDGVLHSVRAAVPALRGSGGGQIVFISSVSAELTVPYAAVYAASKAFVGSIARSLRIELEADNIGVTDMLVGRTDTEFSQTRRGKAGRASSTSVPVMSVEQVAQAVVDAVEKRRKRVVLRPFDRLLLWAHRFVPELIGRQAAKQYK